MSKRLEVIKEALADQSRFPASSISPVLWAAAMAGVLNPIDGLLICELIDELERLKEVYGDRCIVTTGVNPCHRHGNRPTVTIDKLGVHLTLWLKDEEEEK